MLKFLHAKTLLLLKFVLSREKKHVTCPADTGKPPGLHKPDHFIKQTRLLLDQACIYRTGLVFRATGIVFRATGAVRLEPQGLYLEG